MFDKFLFGERFSSESGKTDTAAFSKLSTMAMEEKALVYLGNYVTYERIQHILYGPNAQS